MSPHFFDPLFSHDWNLNPRDTHGGGEKYSKCVGGGPPMSFCFCGGNPIYFSSSGCPPMDQSPLSHLRMPHRLFMEAIGHLVTWAKVQGENDFAERYIWRAFKSA